MSANPSQKESWFANYTTGSTYSANSREPGKYIDALSVPASTTVNVDGKGYGAILVGNASNLVVTASNGTFITSGLTAGNLYEIGIKQVEIGSTGNATIFRLNNANGG